jgi:hypothetical protein
MMISSKEKKMHILVSLPLQLLVALLEVITSLFLFHSLWLLAHITIYDG